MKVKLRMTERVRHAAAKLRRSSAAALAGLKHPLYHDPGFHFSPAKDPVRWCGHKEWTDIKTR